MNSRVEFALFSISNDDMEEGDPGSDSDFEVDAKKEVSDTCEFNWTAPGPGVGKLRLRDPCEILFIESHETAEISPFSQCFQSFQ